MWCGSGLWDVVLEVAWETVRGVMRQVVRDCDAKDGSSGGVLTGRARRCTGCESAFVGSCAECGTRCARTLSREVVFGA